VEGAGVAEVEEVVMYLGFNIRVLLLRVSVCVVLQCKRVSA